MSSVKLVWISIMPSRELRYVVVETYFMILADTITDFTRCWRHSEQMSILPWIFVPTFRVCILFSSGHWMDWNFVHQSLLWSYQLQGLSCQISRHVFEGKNEFRLPRLPHGSRMFHTRPKLFCSEHCRQYVTVERHSVSNPSTTEVAARISVRAHPFTLPSQRSDFPSLTASFRYQLLLLAKCSFGCTYWPQC